MHFDKNLFLLNFILAIYFKAQTAMKPSHHLLQWVLGLNQPGRAVYHLAPSTTKA